MIKEKFISKIATIFGLLLMLYACNAEDDGMSTGKQGTGFDIGSTFVRLFDDSTQTAGYLDITTNSTELNLKWNTLAACNIDTTTTNVKVTGGKYRLPIKWDKLQKDSLYGPSTKAFEAGVAISDGVQSKYVRLFWTDGIDSTQIAKESEVMTRSGNEGREVIMLELLPTEEVKMIKEKGGSLFVNFSGVLVVGVDLENLTDETNIDIGKLPTMLLAPQLIDFTWKNNLAPDINFIKLVRFTANASVYKDAIIRYSALPVITPRYEFKSSLPEKGGLLPATDANVSVTVYTNVSWSVESDLGFVPSIFDNDVTGTGNRNLLLPIQANTGSTQRTVTVIVKSQGIAKDTLTFTQLAGTVEETLEYKSSTLTTGNIPQTGGTYGFVFEGTYTGSLQVRAVVDGVAQTPGTAVTNKQPQCTVPENTLTNERTVTFEYKQADGNWTALPVSTNRTQDAAVSNTLTYVSSNLPTGNIPEEATVYAFNFEGGYTGQMRVRAVDATTGAVLFNGPIVSTHTAKVTVPANTATTTRNIKFEYRLIDIAGSEWIDLPVETNRIQDGKTSVPVTPVDNKVFPAGEIPEDGNTYSCTFEGGPGSVILRAVRTRVDETTGQEVARSADTAVAGNATKVSVEVPSLDGLNATVDFEYSVDGGQNWISLNDRREQKNTWVYVSAPDANTRIPAKGGSVTFTVTGNADMQVTIYAKYGNTDIGQASGTPPSTITVPVGDNPDSADRRVGFMWSLDGEKWITTYYTQLGK